MSSSKLRVAFIAIGVSRDVLDRTEFYRQDIEILHDLGYEVTIINRLPTSFNGVDIAFVWWWTWLWRIGPQLRRSGVPIIATGTLDPLEFDHRPIWQKLLLRYGCRFPARNVFVSRYILEGMASRFPMTNCEVCPHIVTDEYSYDNTIERDPMIIFNVAWKKRQNVIRKMQPEMIDAFAIARARLPGLKLILAGAPMDGEVQLRKRCNELGVERDVRFLGSISRADKITWMRRCGQYYQCSRSEGFGVAIAEAMACGAPVVVNRGTAIPEVVGECGFYVKDESPLAIAEQMVNVATDRESAARIGEAAAERVNRLFRMPVRREYFRSLISSIIANR